MSLSRFTRYRRSRQQSHWITNYILQSEDNHKQKSETVKVLKHIAGPLEDGSIIREVSDQDVYIHATFSLQALQEVQSDEDDGSQQEWDRALIIINKFHLSFSFDPQLDKCEFTICVDSFRIWDLQEGFDLKNKIKFCMDNPKVKEKAQTLWENKKEQLEQNQSCYSIPLTQLLEEMAKDDSQISNSLNKEGNSQEEIPSEMKTVIEGVFTKPFDASELIVSAEDKKKLDNIKEWQDDYIPTQSDKSSESIDSSGVGKRELQVGTSGSEDVIINCGQTVSRGQKTRVDDEDDGRLKSPESNLQDTVNRSLAISQDSIRLSCSPGDQDETRLSSDKLSNNSDSLISQKKYSLRNKSQATNDIPNDAQDVETEHSNIYGASQGFEYCHTSPEEKGKQRVCGENKKQPPLDDEESPMATQAFCPNLGSQILGTCAFAVSSTQNSGDNDGNLSFEFSPLGLDSSGNIDSLNKTVSNKFQFDQSLSPVIDSQAGKNSQTKNGTQELDVITRTPQRKLDQNESPRLTRLTASAKKAVDVAIETEDEIDRLAKLRDTDSVLKSGESDNHRKRKQNHCQSDSSVEEGNNEKKRRKPNTPQSEKNNPKPRTVLSFNNSPKKSIMNSNEDVTKDQQKCGSKNSELIKEKSTIEGHKDSYKEGMSSVMGQVWRMLIRGAKSKTEDAKSKAEGAKSKTEGAKSKAEGAKSKAEGAKSKIEGAKSKTEGAKSKAEGAKSKAEGAKSKAEGAKSKAEGAKSKIEGAKSKTEGAKSITESKNAKYETEINTDESRKASPSKRREGLRLRKGARGRQKSEDDDEEEERLQDMIPVTPESKVATKHNATSREGGVKVTENTSSSDYEILECSSSDQEETTLSPSLINKGKQRKHDSVKDTETSEPSTRSMARKGREEDGPVVNENSRQNKKKSKADVIVISSSIDTQGNSELSVQDGQTELDPRHGAKMSVRSPAKTANPKTSPTKKRQQAEKMLKSLTEIKPQTDIGKKLLHMKLPDNLIKKIELYYVE